MAALSHLLKYREVFSDDGFGEWVYSRDHAGTREDSMPMPYVDYSKAVNDFEQCIYKIADAHPEYDLHNYSEVLERNGLEWGAESLANADAFNADEQCILAMLMGVIRGDRFCEGIVLKFLRDGHIQRWLKRLQEIEMNKKEDTADLIVLCSRFMHVVVGERRFTRIESYETDASIK